MWNLNKLESDYSKKSNLINFVQQKSRFVGYT